MAATTISSSIGRLPTRAATSCGQAVEACHRLVRLAGFTAEARALGSAILVGIDALGGDSAARDDSAGAWLDQVCEAFRLERAEADRASGVIAIADRVAR